MKLYFLNVGYGEAIVARSDSGYTVVIDGGPRHTAEAEPDAIALDEFLRRESCKRVDLVILTHIHDDHISGLVPVVEGWDIGEIWCNITPNCEIAPALERLRPHLGKRPGSLLFWRALQSYECIRTIAQQQGIPLRSVCGGETYQLGGLTLALYGMNSDAQRENQQQFERMLATSEPGVLFKRFDESDCICNSTSLALTIGEGDFRALLTGDKVHGWDILRRECDLQATVLKITHHGQLDGMPQDMLEGADPEIIVTCVDRKRTFYGGNPVVLDRAAAYLRTKSREPRIFITGALREQAPYGSVLELSWDRKTKRTNSLVKTYE